MTDTLSDERLANIRSNLGQYIVREIDQISLSLDDALWLHTLAKEALALRAAANSGVVVTDDRPRPLVDELTGALRFILAFYEPRQNYLDTNAWKVAEAGGRNALAKGEAFLSEQAAKAETAALTGEPQTVEPVAVPVLYVSPGQLEDHSDPMDDGYAGGCYIPARKTMAGKFTQPLYAQPQPAAVPDGWVMVPRIETDEMCEIGLEALRDNLGHEAVIMRDAAACYRAMLAAAPTLATKPEGER